jgi:hypothetical protein
MSPDTKPHTRMLSVPRYETPHPNIHIAEILLSTTMGGQSHLACPPTRNPHSHVPRYETPHPNIHSSARSWQRRRGGALLLPKIVCGAGTVEANKSCLACSRGAARSQRRRRRRVGGLLLPQLVCGAGTVEAKRPSPTRTRGSARSLQQRRGGALQLPELVCSAGTVEAKKKKPLGSCALMVQQLCAADTFNRGLVTTSPR